MFFPYEFWYTRVVWCIDNSMIKACDQSYKHIIWDFRGSSLSCSISSKAQLLKDFLSGRLWRQLFSARYWSCLLWSSPCGPAASARITLWYLYLEENWEVTLLWQKEKTWTMDKGALHLIPLSKTQSLTAAGKQKTLTSQGQGQQLQPLHQFTGGNNVSYFSLYLEKNNKIIFFNIWFCRYYRYSPLDICGTKACILQLHIWQWLHLHTAQ